MFDFKKLEVYNKSKIFMKVFIFRILFLGTVLFIGCLNHDKNEKLTTEKLRFK